METKICTKCNIDKDIDSYSKHRNKKFGNSWCKHCVRDYNKIYCSENKERIKAKRIGYYNSYYQNNKEKVAKKNRAWYENNPSYNKEYAERNASRLKKQKQKYCSENREKINKQKLARKHSDSLVKLLINRRSRRNAILKYKYQTTKEALGCSVLFWREHLEIRFSADMTWENYGTYWHLDEIIPCSAWNLTDPIEQKACFHYMNSQPLEKFFNLSKGGANTKDYANEKAEFLMVLRALGEI